MLGQNLQNVVGQIMDFYLAKTYKKVLPKTLDENDYDRKNRYNYEKAKRFGYYNEIF